LVRPGEVVYRFQSFSAADKKSRASSGPASGSPQSTERKSPR
jgi:hypothetical protein